MLDINEHLKPDDKLKTKEWINKFKNDSLEPVVFERLNSMRVSQSKYLLTSFIDFTMYKQSVSSLLTYCQLCLQNVQGLMETMYSQTLSLQKDQRRLRIYKAFLQESAQEVLSFYQS